MNKQRFDNPSEREGYQKGFRDGYSEGLKKAVLLINLVALSSADFEESILQNSKENVELRKLIVGEEKEDK